jgi:stage V sporulation protein B
MRSTDSTFDCLRAFAAGRGTGTVIQLLAFLPLPLGFLFLQKSVEDAEETILSYGTYLSGFAAVSGIAVCIVIWLMLPVEGRIWEHIKKEEQRYTRNVFQGGAHLCLVHGICLAVMLIVLSSCLGVLTGGESADEAGAMFLGGGLTVLFLPAALYFGKVLRLIGNKVLVLASLAVSDMVYVVTITVFMNAGKMKVTALVYGGLIWAGVLCVLLGFFAYRQLRCHFDWLRFLMLPAGAAAVSGLFVMWLEKMLSPHIGSLVILVVCLPVGAGIYWGLVLLARSFREQELELLPGGRIIIAAGQMLHVF